MHVTSFGTETRAYFPVSLQPVFVGDEGPQAPDFHAVVRGDTGAVLGIHRGSYKLVLELAPAECEAWREGVRAYHRRFAVGQCVHLIRCRIPWVRITQLKPLRGEYGDIVYRLRRADLGELLTEAAP
ncbi:MAG: hypothetical protein ACREYE_21530 [Gammaproteobacteria bacterium]